MRPNRLSYRIGAAAIAVGLILLGSAPAYAAAPGNDTFGGAVAVGAVPFSTTQDTSQATTDADDSAANANCGAPSMDASVWYSVTPATDQSLLVDVSASSYSAGVLVVTGGPGAFQLVACGPRTIAFPASAGTTYYLIAIDDQSDGTGNGGTLELSIDTAPPPPTITATVDPTAGFTPKTGSATVHGTIACAGVVDFAFVDLELHQPVGRGEVVGFGTMDVRCDGAARPWSIEVFPSAPGTKFSGGKAASLTFAVACGPLSCSFDFQQHQVRLTGKG